MRNLVQRRGPAFIGRLLFVKFGSANLLCVSNLQALKERHLFCSHFALCGNFPWVLTVVIPGAGNSQPPRDNIYGKEKRNHEKRY
jgi:hypothetical protein